MGRKGKQRWVLISSSQPVNHWGRPRAWFLGVKPERSIEDKTSISLSPSRLFIAARIKVGMTEMHWAMTSATGDEAGPKRSMMASSSERRPALGIGRRVEGRELLESAES